MVQIPLFAVIDTNVVISALLIPNSYPAKILSYVYYGYIIPLYNQEILKEYFEVMNRPKFHFLESQIVTMMDSFVKYGKERARIPANPELFPDKKDLVFYEIKLSTEDAYLITGNIRHFPEEPFVVNPKQMVEILQELTNS